MSNANESGQTLAESALILSLIGVVLIAVIIVGGEVRNLWQHVIDNWPA